MVGIHFLFNDHCICCRFDDFVLQRPEYYPMWAHHLKKENPYENCARMITCGCRGQYKNRMPPFKAVRTKGFTRQKYYDYCVSTLLTTKHILFSSSLLCSSRNDLVLCFHVVPSVEEKLRQNQSDKWNSGIVIMSM